MNAGDDPAKLARQHRTRFCKLFIAQDFAGDGLALNPLHDESGAELVGRLQHMHHAWRRQAGIVRELHQHSLGIEPGGTPRRRAITWRRPAQDRADIAARVHDIERPGLLAGAAREFRRASDAGRARIPGGNAASELLLDHLPLNFAGRFSRNAVTPSLKSSAAPAMRCDWNSRLSCSSKEFSGLSQYSFRISDSAIVGPFARSCASFMASSIRTASSWTRLTRPHSSAFSAGSRSPISDNSTERALPISRGNSQVEPQSGTRPMRRNACRKYDERAHRIMSPISAKLMPAPAAGPLTEVTIGQCRLRSRRRNGWNAVSSAAPALLLPGFWLLRPCRLAPA